MKVKMIASITGTRDGQEWPAAGETVELPAAEAADLVEAGLAEPVGGRSSTVVEAAAVVAPEDAAAPKPRARRAPAKKD